MEMKYNPSAIPEIYERIREEIGKVIVGQHAAVDQLLIALFSSGHVLIEGVPGLGKTLLINGLSHVVDGAFKRIQFTPDLMPSDIIGTTLFHMESARFIIKKGPIFTNLLLADEINRSPAKTQAALLQVMQENTVSIDGKDHLLDDFFMCMATQNPMDMEGTYPLPEAQIDRFMLKIMMTYPEIEEEERILKHYRNGFSVNALFKAGIKKVIEKSDIQPLKQVISKVTVDDKIIHYITRIVEKTRHFPGVQTGASPRASVALFKASQVHAAFNGRDFVTPDDVKSLVHPVLRHRLLLEAESEIEGITSDDIIQKLLEGIKVPR